MVETHDAHEMLSVSDVQLQIHAENWEDAIRKAAAPLLVSGKIEQSYIDEMIEGVKTLGPYIVLAPGLALGHARPSDAVHQPCLAIATLDTPIEFGSKENDPVDIVFILASINDTAHIQLIQKIVLFMNRPHAFEMLRQARTGEEAEALVSAILA